MPLSGMALWLADSITPRSAPSAPVRNATAGVGSTPTRSTSTPALARPATTAASRNSPDARGSRPTTAVGRWPWNVPASASTCAAATDRPSAISAVRSALATPRTPSVPKSRPTCPPEKASVTEIIRSHEPLSALCRYTPKAVINERPGGTVACRRGVRTYRQLRLTLAVLRGLAGLLETGLLALDRTVVAAEEAGLLEGAAVVVHVGLVQRAGHAEAQGTGLTGDTATRDAGDDVVAALELEHLEGLVDFLLVHLVGG